MSEKLPHAIGRDVDNRQAIDRDMCLSADERDEQCQRVTVAPLRVSREVALVDQMLQQKAPEPGPELRVIAHDDPPGRRSVRSGGTLLGVAPGSS